VISIESMMASGVPAASLQRTITPWMRGVA
jgi:hypothetical protein